jgi:hypothetical protein
MQNKFMRVALICLGAAAISGCYSSFDRSSSQAYIDFEARQASLEQQRQEAAAAYRSKFSYLVYHYDVRLYKTELKADGSRVKTGQPVKEFSITTNGGEIAEFRYDSYKPSPDDKPLDESELTYVGKSNYGAEYDLRPEVQEKYPGSIEFKVDPNLSYARGRAWIVFKARRTVGVVIPTIEPKIMTSSSTVTVGNFTLTLQSKDGSDFVREGKKEFVVDAFFVELDVTASGKLKPEDVVATIPGV